MRATVKEKSYTERRTAQARLVAKTVGRSNKKSQWIHPSRMEIFKCSLRNGVNTLSINGVEQRGKERGKPRDSFQQSRKQLFKNRTNKADIDGVKTQILKQHSQRLGVPVGSLVVPQHKRTLNKSAVLTLVWAVIPQAI